MTASHRLPLLALIGCLFLSACDQSGTPPATASQDEAPAIEQEQPVAAPSIDPATLAGPTTLTEIDEAARSAEMSASGLCNFDTINGQRIGDATSVRVQDPAAFSVSGWLVEKREMLRPQGVLRLQEVNGGRAWEIGVGPGTSRGDVGRHLKKEELKDAGFEVQSDLSSLPAGEYVLSLNHYSGDRRVACDKGRRILLGG